MIAAEANELVARGVQTHSIHLQASRLLQLQYNVNGYVQAAASQIFKALDKDKSGILDLEEWRKSNLAMPRAYNKLRIMMSVMANPALEGFRPCFANSESSSSTKDCTDDLWTCYFTQAQLEKVLIERVVEARDDECLVTWENFKGAPTVWVPKSSVIHHALPASGRLDSEMVSLWEEYEKRNKAHTLRSLAHPDSVRRATRRFEAAHTEADTARTAAELINAAASHLMVQLPLDGTRLATAWMAPGSILLAGQECDYQGGKVTTVTVQRCVGVVCLPRSDNNIRLWAAATPSSLQTPHCPQHNSTPPLLLSMVPNEAYWQSKEEGGSKLLPPGWERPIVAVAQHLVAMFPEKRITGGDICVASNIPEASDLNEAEAMATAAVRALATANGIQEEAMLEKGLPLAEFVSHALARYDSLKGHFWYDEQDAFGVCNAGAMAAIASVPRAICKFDRGTKYHDGVVDAGLLPPGYYFVVAAFGTQNKGRKELDLNRAKARAAHVAWCSGARRTEERNLAEAYEMGLTPATMAKAVRYHFRSGGQARDPLPGEKPLASHPIQTRMPSGEMFDEEALVARVLDFGAEQLAADEMLDAVKNLAVHQGPGEEHALHVVATRCLKRLKQQLDAVSPEITFLVQNAKECGAVAAGAAGHGAAWAVIKAQHRAEALRFEAAWRHAHATEFNIACDMFISTPPGGGMQYERGNYFD
jgi:hypothetical protein